jgi:hypothetical protein
MARKELTYIAEDGRDKERGTKFKITEMPAAQAERWAMRALMALMKSGVQIPDNFEKLGMSGMAEMGIRAVAGLDWETAEPLLNEMMSCVQLIPDPTKPFFSRPLTDDDIEEISTRLKLRLEVFKLHTDFLQAVAK